MDSGIVGPAMLPDGCDYCAPPCASADSPARAVSPLRVSAAAARCVSVSFASLPMNGNGTAQMLPVAASPTAARAYAPSSSRR